MHSDPTAQRGFTLIELSIVLVIIGLIVGGVLLGRDLIRAAAVRATISQIEKYNTAANTFRGKYGYLPGDIKDPEASQFGFAPRGQYPGQGDGNGVLQGTYLNTPGSISYNCVFTGEEATFWVDLSQAGLIDGSFNTATATATAANVTGSAINSYFPQAKTGHGAYVYVWSGGRQGQWRGVPGDSLNYFGISGVTGSDGNCQAYTAVALTVSEAHAIDKKTDDGMPQSGSVLALDAMWWATNAYDLSNGGAVIAGDGVATAPSSTTCYDNGSVAGATEQYSVATNSGAGLNCSLSFRFQ